MTFMVDGALTVKEQLIRADGSAEGAGGGGEGGKEGRRTQGVKVGKEGALPAEEVGLCVRIWEGESLNALS